MNEVVYVEVEDLADFGVEIETGVTSRLMISLQFDPRLQGFVPILWRLLQTIERFL